MSSYRNPSMPAGINYLHVTLALATFSFAILFSSLTLYLTNVLKFIPYDANGIVALFFAFNFALHLVAGYLGSRLLNYRNLLTISVLFELIGIFILSGSAPESLYFGLSCFLIGCGFNTTCINCLLTQKLSNNDAQRESAFFINYFAMNVGFLLGFITSGYFDIQSNYKNLFQLSCVVNLISLIIIMIGWRYFDVTNKNDRSHYQRRQLLLGIISITLLILTMILAFHYAAIANYIVLLTGLVALSIFTYAAIRCKNSVERHKIIAFIILAIASILFWMLFFVGPMGIIYFLKNNTNTLFLSYKISPQWFLNLNSIFVIVSTPLAAHFSNQLKAKGFDIPIAKQFALALLLIALSFYVLVLGIHCSDSAGMTGTTWIVLHFLIQAIAEVLLAPLGYAMIGKLAPPHLQGIMMGFWMMVAGISATLSHYFSNLMTQTNSIDPLISNPYYLSVFNQLSVYGLFTGAILFTSAKYIHNLINNKEEMTSRSAIRATSC